MRGRDIYGAVVGVLLVLSAGAHAFLGWPSLRPALQDAHLDPNVIGALAAGWYFGSVAMLAFGAILIAAAFRGRGAGPARADAVWIIAVAYVGFGVAAYLLRHFHPHFLAFVGFGVLVGVVGWLWRGRPGPT